MMALGRVIDERLKLYAPDKAGAAEAAADDAPDDEADDEADDNGTHAQ